MLSTKCTLCCTIASLQKQTQPSLPDNPKPWHLPRHGRRVKIQASDRWILIDQPQCKPLPPVAVIPQVFHESEDQRMVLHTPPFSVPRDPSAKISPFTTVQWLLAPSLKLYKCVRDLQPCPVALILTLVLSSHMVSHGHPLYVYSP